MFLTALAGEDWAWWDGLLFGCLAFSGSVVFDVCRSLDPYLPKVCQTEIRRGRNQSCNIVASFLDSPLHVWKYCMWWPLNPCIKLTFWQVQRSLCAIITHMEESLVQGGTESWDMHVVYIHLYIHVVHNTLMGNARSLLNNIISLVLKPVQGRVTWYIIYFGPRLIFIYHNHVHNAYTCTLFQFTCLSALILPGFIPSLLSCFGGLVDKSAGHKSQRLWIWVLRSSSVFFSLKLAVSLECLNLPYLALICMYTYIHVYVHLHVQQYTFWKKMRILNDLTPNISLWYKLRQCWRCYVLFVCCFCCELRIVQCTCVVNDIPVCRASNLECLRRGFEFGKVVSRLVLCCAVLLAFLSECFEHVHQNVYRGAHTLDRCDVVYIVKVFIPLWMIYSPKK